MKNVMFDSIDTQSYVGSNTASYKGIMTKTAFFVFLTITFAILTMIQLPNITDTSGFMMVLFGSMIGGAIAGMVAMRSVRFSMVAGVIYTACQGILLGTMVALTEIFVPGAGTMALGVTFAILAVMLSLYASGIVRNTPMIKKFTMILFMTVVLIMIVSLFLWIFNVDFLWSTGTGWYINVAISGIFLLFGIFMLIQDFDRMQNMVDGGFDKQYEWNAAIGLVATLILIYVEVLRLILLFSRHFRD